MIVLIVTLVMKIMEYVKKKIIMIIYYQNLVFIPWGVGVEWTSQRQREGSYKISRIES